MDDYGAHSGAIAIVGAACRFPGASDAAELHDLVMAGRRMFRPLPQGHGGPVHAALIDGWTPGGALADPAAQPDTGPLRKLVTETIALARADAGMHDEYSERLGRSRMFLTGLPGPDGDALVAVALACDALAAGEVDVAIAGGVQLGLDPRWLAGRAAAGELGTSQMRVYDAEPAGMLPGDGCGVVVLMRSAQARPAGRAVYAELTGWTVTEPGDFSDLLRAYDRAGVSPADIALIEGRGYGTDAADTAELALLAQLRADARDAAVLGAVSASIGFTRAAAGAASLIKTVAALVTGTIPPSTGWHRPHAMIESGAARVRLPQAPEPWPDGTRLAAVSSVQPEHPGAHLILRREPDGSARPGRRRRAAEDNQTPAAAPVPGNRAAGAVPKARSAALARSGPAHVFAFCGPDPAMLASTLDVIADSAAELAGTDLADLARHLAAGAQRAAERGAPLRVTVTATAPGQLAQRARRAASMMRTGPAGRPRAPMVAEDGICVSAGVRGRVAVVFPRLAITSSDHAAMLTSSLGSLRTLGQLGVTGCAAVGYSAGEIAGLVWAGCLSSAEASRLAALRGQVLTGCVQRQAAMVRVFGDSAVARRMCDQNGLHFAAYETDRSHVLAGSAADVRNLTLHAAAIGIETEVLAVTCALHTPAVARCAAPMRGVLSGIPFSPPRRPLISTVTGRLVTGADDLTGLLTEQLSKPVLFTQAMAAAAEHADLIVVAGADDQLAVTAAQAGARPAVMLTAHSAPVPDTIAALFAAGAIPAPTGHVSGGKAVAWG